LFHAHYSLGNGASLCASFLELFDEADMIINALDEFCIKIRGDLRILHIL
jgi:hypothetical protein